MTLFKFSFYRQLHIVPTLPTVRVTSEVSCRLPGLMKEHELKLGEINKVFASRWLNEGFVAFGSKCNKLFVVDVRTKQMRQIPSLDSSSNSNPAESPCGIHCIDINPSGRLLATGGVNVNDVAVYKLPTFDPLAVGEAGHQDWVFDCKWVDDEFLVSGSRDSKLILWKFDEDDVSKAPPSSSLHKHLEEDQLYVPQHSFCKPVVTKECKEAQRIRALAYSSDRTELAALSMNAYLHLWDANTFTQKIYRKLKLHRENVCLAANKLRNVYAIGSLSDVTIIDPLCLKSPIYISLRQSPCGIRSLNFIDDILSIGTGNGFVHFYDMRAGRLLELGCGHPCSLSMGDGWLLHDDVYREIFHDTDYPNAVYTHCFDPSGTRMFSAGGPLPVGLWGNYGGLWQ
ncbi:hypothetical protein CAPTEDRAFT_101926 [Capitella teleta]|uniref:DDB1- and CUL4-associated factor 12 beta-propeller domain-containing protein n=1 Tax=Capitella teleta TaxID=283909 RepID=R7TUA3_CAPTE|nr:hypothetical protein CAPTEDRAFT_101926 [Capitella teleta]|eukprot:ELT97249.1 hypothetical protein CAPTEDRAFT_101926 [Capitella teleta]